MKKIKALLSFIIFTTMFSTAYVPDTILVSADSSHAPFDFIEEDGSLRGMYIDFWQLLSEKTGLPVKFIPTGDKLELLRKNEVQAVSDLFFTPGSENEFDLTNSFYTVDANVFYSDKLIKLQNFSELSGFHIGVIENHYAQYFMNENYPNISLRKYKTYAELFRDFKQEKLKVFIMDYLIAVYNLNQENLLGDFNYIEQPIYTSKVYAAVQKGNKELLEIIKNGFSEFKDSEVKEIEKKWLGFVQYKKFPYKYGVFAAAVILAIILFLFLVNRQLHMKIDESTAELLENKKELERSQEVLNIVNSQLKSILDSAIQVAVIAVNNKGKITLFNPGAEIMLGYSKNEVMNKMNISDLHLSSELETKRFKIQEDTGKQLKLHEVLFLNAQKEEYKEEEWTYVRKNNERITVSLGVSIIKTSRGGIGGYLIIAKDITMRKKTEDALKENEEFLYTIIDNIPSMLIVKTADDLRFAMLNKAAEELIGFPQEVLLGKTNFDILPKEQAEELDKTDKEVIKSKTPLDIDEIRLESPTKGDVILQIRKIPILDKYGNTEFILSISHNITETVQARETLIETKNRYKNIFQNVGVSLWEEDISVLKKEIKKLHDRGITDINTFLDDNPGFVLEAAKTTKVLDVNNVTIDLYGAESKRELLGSIEKTFTEDSYTVMKKMINAVAQDSGYFQSEMLSKTLDGRILNVLYTLSIPPLDSENGILLQSIIDISALKETERFLEEEKERLAVTLRSIGDGVISTDINANIVLMNKKAEELTGWKWHYTRGRTLDFIFRIIDEKTKQPLKSPLNQVMSIGSVVKQEKNTILIDKNENELHISYSCAPLKDRESNIIGSVIVFRDISNIKKYETELLKTQELEALGVLAGGIAHDFNNILTAILGNIALAKFKIRDNPSLTKMLDEAEKASVRAKNLTQQLLTFSKGGSPVKEVGDITDVLKDTAVFALRGSNVSAEFDFEEGLWLSEYDEGQISQVINNLVINANQAMPEGGRILITAENVVIGAEAEYPLKSGKYIKIELSDQGIGIPKKHLERIFTPYFTTKEKGSGLGLATTYSIIKKHGGHIAVDSIIGEGTKFSIYLPAAGGQTAKKDLEKAPALRGTGKVLIMDDEEMILDVASELLMHLGYTVDTARNGEEAFAKYMKMYESGIPYDVVIMDLTIPGGMGGRELMQRLRERDPGITAIVSSGYSNDPIMANFEDYGFKGIITKPYQIEEISRTLNSVLNDKE